MNIQDILALAALGVVGGGVIAKKRKKKEKENVNCCPKCGSRRIQKKKGGKMRCLDCGKESYCVREIYVEMEE